MAKSVSSNLRSFCIGVIQVSLSPVALVLLLFPSVARSQSTAPQYTPLTYLVDGFSSDVAALALILIEGLVIGGLLIERRRRRRVEDLRLQLGAIVESSRNDVITVTLSGEILSWNAGAESMYGYKSADVLGRHLSILAPPEGKAQQMEVLRKIKDGERVEDYEAVRLKKDGGHIEVSLSLSPIRNSDGRVIAAASIGRDITASKQAQRELQWLTARLLDFQDNERRRLARELHDVTAQNLFAISINLSRLEGGSLESSQIHAVLTESKRLCEEALQEIRTLSYLLHPPMLERRGLVGALTLYVDGFVKRSGVNVDMGSIADIGRLALDVEMALFRIVQESLTNIRRHSGGAAAAISLYREKAQIILQIRDYGRGMPMAGSMNEVEGVGVGIAGMQQRLRQLGGVLEIESSGSGAIVTAKVPVE